MTAATRLHRTADRIAAPRLPPEKPETLAGLARRLFEGAPKGVRTMESWHPLSGEIPLDPPDAPWHFEAGDPPAEIIRRMRNVWTLRKGGSPEYAQALFANAGTWLDRLQDARADSRALSRAGIRVNAHARPDTWPTYLARAEGGIETRIKTRIKAAALSKSETVQTAILAIYAAHQAILTGWRDSWALAMELSAAAQKSFSDRVIPARADRRREINSANAERSRAREAADAEILKKARELLAGGTNRRDLASKLAQMKWPGSQDPQSRERVRLSADYIRRRLRPLLKK